PGPVALAQDPDPLLVDVHVALMAAHAAREVAVVGVVLEQQRVGAGAGRIVDRDDLDLVRPPDPERAKGQSPDAAEPVDRDSPALAGRPAAVHARAGRRLVLPQLHAVRRPLGPGVDRAEQLPAGLLRGQALLVLDRADADLLRADRPARPARLAAAGHAAEPP